MKCKAIGFLILILMSRSSFSQPQTPLTVETLLPIPTVVKTGELFSQVYRVRFPDLVEEGKEILVLEDRMVPESLTVNPFEAMTLDVEKRRIENEYIWDFTYAFRIVNPAKEAYLLPSFSFYWLLRDLGESIEDVEVQLLDTNEVFINYVTTVTNDPVIDVRDVVEIGDFRIQENIWKAVAWTIAPLPLVVWLVMFIKMVRRPRVITSVRVKAEEDFTAIRITDTQPSAYQARRNLRKHLKALSNSDYGHATDRQALADFWRDSVILLREFLRSELSDLNPGDTPKDIKQYIEQGVTEGPRKEALLALASRMVFYQSGLERGAVAQAEDLNEEIRVLEHSLTQFRFDMRIWGEIRGKRDRIVNSLLQLRR